MEECVFCKISENIVSSYKIYEDEDIIAVLNIFPVNPGHILIFPRKHIEELEKMDDGLFIKIMIFAKKLSEVLKILFNTNKMLIFLHLNKEYEKTKHISVEIIPRFEGDDIKLILPRKKAESSDLELLRNKIINMIQITKEEERKVEEKEKEINIDEMLKWIRKNI